MSPRRSLVVKALMIACLGAVLLGGGPHAEPPATTHPGALTTQATPTAIHQLLAGSVERLLTLHTPTTYLHSDTIGSVVLATSSTGKPQGRTSFTPTGETHQWVGHPGDYGFTGQERDASSGLHHFKFRYLDAHSGRWVSPDPLFALSTPANLARVGQSTTAYAYVAGRFINNADPSGLSTSGPFESTGKLGVVFEEKGRPDKTKTGSAMGKAGFRLEKISQNGAQINRSIKSAGFIGHTQFHEATGERTQRFALPDSAGNFAQVSPEVMADRIATTFPKIETVVIMGCHAAARDGVEEGVTQTMVERVSTRLKELGKTVDVIGSTGVVSFKGHHGTAFDKTDHKIYRGGVFASKGGKAQTAVKPDKLNQRTGKAFGKK